MVKRLHIQIFPEIDQLLHCSLTTTISSYLVDCSTVEVIQNLCRQWQNNCKALI